MTSTPLGYTAIEVRSYLPGGWTLLDITESSSDDLWMATVTDGADVGWTLEVKASAAGQLGRAQALSQAVDRVYRESLG